MTRVLFVSAEPVGAAMAGPAIRVVELARVLSRHCHVTVAAPPPSDPAVVPGALLEAGLSDFEPLLDALRQHDVVVAQRLSPQLLRYAARLPVRFVADLYNPQMIEVLEAAGGEGGESSARRAWRSMLGQCAVADLVLCASEKQRDLWLGGMALSGLLDPERYRSDPTFRAFVDVVPFGLPEEPPQRDAPVLKGVWPGIGADDRVLLWAGGVWRWLDALTPIRALERLGVQDPPVHLVFLGTARPALEPGDVPASHDEALRFARERGLEGVRVHFNPGWVPYAERGAYLLEADIGVCAHHDHLEARFSFRTRVLDHLWAGLPSVVSAGDSMGDLVEGQGLGRAVPPDDDQAFGTALAELLGDSERYAGVRERVAGFAPSLRWSECARPLVDFSLDLAARRPRRSPPGTVARATLGQYRDVLADAREHGGVREAVRALGRHLGRAVRHRA